MSSTWCRWPSFSPTPANPDRPEETGAGHADPVQEVPGEAGKSRGQGDRNRRTGGEKRNREEAIANSIGTLASKIGDLEFPDFSKEGRAMIIAAMNSLKDALDEAIPRAVKNQKKPM